MRASLETGVRELPVEGRNKAILVWQQELFGNRIKPVKLYCLTTPYTRVCHEFTEEALNTMFCHLT